MQITQLKSRTLALYFTLCAISPISSALSNTDNVYFSGMLVAEACTLRPGDESIRVDFGEIFNKYLYKNGRTPSQPFQLHLLDCDLSIGKQLSVSFSGKESSALPGLLAVTPNNSGIAIGIEDAEGKTIAINSGSKEIALENGNIPLKFAAWIQSEPQAIQEHTISSGGFSAVATFRLEYY
ncbi:fimbrial protein [Erwinia sp. V90_4]|uniref:fimbrial protein n=1 Tax=Erwinia TaxID=551 RepID=UPI00249DD2D3|nr:fimbrial protein [Erwinia sp. V90_4]MDI3440667.1 fimbrial protein [Erwinia sp. V90_4]